MTIRRRGNRVILSGDNVRLRKVQNADPVIINYLRSLFLEAEDETELKFETDEDKETSILPGGRQEEWLAFKGS